MAGPLAGIRIIEIAGIGPGPFAGMMFADMGAEVITVDRPGGNPGAGIGHTVLFRGRRSIAVDLKTDEGAEVVRRLADGADAIFEGYRPGVAERLGIGPDVLLERNPRLVYGRMTGWGQTGPMAHAAGHDINYIALAGALDAIGRPDSGPVPPLNLVGDFGGGGMLLIFGMVCAMLDAQRSGQGQVVDAAMVDGTSALMAMFHGMREQNLMPAQRGTGLLDGGAPFYDTYETADGKWVALGPIEPQFYATFLELTGLDADPDVANQMDMANWGLQKERIAAAIRSRPRAEWDELLLGTDACYAPVLSLDEAMVHPANVERDMFPDVGGNPQPAPAPRFSRTVPDAPTPKAAVGTHTRAVLADAGFADEELRALLADGVIAEA